jgi:tRNA pseudouridine32 synthase/23S rRNA pseudouridine746 synthase
MVCPTRGKPALTGWRVLARESGATRLELRPLTGRSHQLRVHLLAIGHPILGDPFYGDPAAAPRMQLHAARIGFRHPDGGARVEFGVQVPF